MANNYNDFLSLISNYFKESFSVNINENSLIEKEIESLHFMMLLTEVEEHIGHELNLIDLYSKKEIETIGDLCKYFVTFINTLN